MPNVSLLNADCRVALAGLDDCSVDAIVTDPPYELGFMGKSWDSTGVAYDVDLWRECLRVLKPGGHLLAFGGTRTWHRLACAIEDAGFEIRDSIAWLYGSGFPKSLDVSKAIDKSTGENRQRQLRFTEWMRSTGITARQINDATGTKMAGHYLTDNSQPAIATADLFDLLRPYLPEVPEEIERLVAERTGIEWTAYKNRPTIGVTYKVPNGAAVNPHFVSIGEQRADAPASRDYAPTAPATSEAQQWQGWGTALKPAHEPIVVARKPLIGTVAANVLAHGTGALNIDACRVGFTSDADRASASPQGKVTSNANAGATPDLDGSGRREIVRPDNSAGRWPANVVIDETTATLIDQQSGKAGAAAPVKQGHSGKSRGIYGDYAQRGDDGAIFYGDTGGASRFFYCAKAPSSERPKVDGIAHPTVKPLTLMRWLVRLVTPPNGVVLEPFAGSGTTIEAALLEGFNVIGIEQSSEYVPLIEARIARVRESIGDGLF